MATLLDEIMIEAARTQGTVSYYPATHAAGCRCANCRKPGASPATYKNWRERRKERLSPPKKQCAAKGTGKYGTGEDRFLGSVLGTAVRMNAATSRPGGKAPVATGKLSDVAGNTTGPVVSIGNRQRAVLLGHWDQKITEARNPLIKKRYEQYKEVIRKRLRPSWHQSEKDLQLFFRRLGMPGQRTFLNSRPAPWVTRGNRRYPPRGSVIPDINPADTMIEIKNYNIQNQGALIRDLLKQIARRRLHGPKDAAGQPLQQRVILDMRGQNATWDQLNGLARTVSTRTGLPLSNIRVVTWEIYL